MFPIITSEMNLIEPLANLVAELLRTVASIPGNHDVNSATRAIVEEIEMISDDIIQRESECDRREEVLEEYLLEAMREVNASRSGTSKPVDVGTTPSRVTGQTSLPYSAQSNFNAPLLTRYLARVVGDQVTSDVKALLDTREPVLERHLERINKMWARRYASLEGEGKQECDNHKAKIVMDELLIDHQEREIKDLKARLTATKSTNITLCERVTTLEHKIHLLRKQFAETDKPKTKTCQVGNLATRLEPSEASMDYIVV